MAKRMAGLVVGGLAIVFALGTPVSAATPFTDIADSKFRSDIDWAFNHGVTFGCAPTRFCPDGLVNREQMATFLSRMFDLPSTTEDFFDDDNSSPHEANINRVAAAGITAGCDTNRYCPTGLVTRAQMASFIARAAGLATGAGRNYFWDDNGAVHEPNIDLMAAAGMTSGCAEYRFCPSGVVTRAQMAAFLHRVETPRSAPPYPAPPPPTPAPTPAPSNCHASYQGYCLRTGVGDWDCAGGSGNGPNYVPVRVRVVGPDVFGLDSDNDGFGCDTLPAP